MHGCIQWCSEKKCWQLSTAKELAASGILHDRRYTVRRRRCRRIAQQVVGALRSGYIHHNPIDDSSHTHTLDSLVKQSHLFTTPFTLLFAHVMLRRTESFARAELIHAQKDQDVCQYLRPHDQLWVKKIIQVISILKNIGVRSVYRGLV